MAGERAFSATELTTMQAAQTEHMMDTCTIDAYTDAGADVYNNPNPAWPTGSATACGYRPAKADEVLEDSNVPVFDAEIRLPVGTALDPRDRITITHRHGVALSPAITHEIVGEPKRGPSGLVLMVKVVTDGS